MEIFLVGAYHEVGRRILQGKVRMRYLILQPLPSGGKPPDAKNCGPEGGIPINGGIGPPPIGPPKGRGLV